MLNRQPAQAEATATRAHHQIRTGGYGESNSEIEFSESDDDTPESRMDGRGLEAKASDIKARNQGSQGQEGKAQ